MNPSCFWLSSHLRIQISRLFAKRLHLFLESKPWLALFLYHNINSSPQRLQNSPGSFRRGSFKFRSIALPSQGIAIQYLQLILEIPAIPALLLFAPGKVLIEEGIDKHSCNTTAEPRCSESGPALRAFIHQLAINLCWGPLTIDLFATASNSFTPRGSEPDLGTSRCSQCGTVNSELILPPESLLPSTSYKAFSNQTRGFIVATLAFTQHFRSSGQDYAQPLFFRKTGLNNHPLQISSAVLEAPHLPDMRSLLLTFLACTLIVQGQLLHLPMVLLVHMRQHHILDYH